MGSCLDKLLKKQNYEMFQSEQSRLELTASQTNIRDVYEFQGIIGEGTFGVVKLAQQKYPPTNKQIAIKILDRTKLKDKYYFLLRELEIIRTLDHPNIIKFYEVYQNDMFCYICTEYCQGGSLLDLLIEKKSLSEKQASHIMEQLFSAVNHMQSKGIVHRDLKPENILFLSDQPDSEIKIVDFGLSNRLNKGSYLKTMVGSSYYVSPGVLMGKYDQRCDNWSLGVILYLLLVGYPPFYDLNKQVVYQKIQVGEYDMKGEQWDKISDLAKDLIRKLLVVDREKRLLIDEALKHPWIQHYKKLRTNLTNIENTSSNSSEPIVTQRESGLSNLLINYSNTTKLKKEFMKVLINQYTEEEIQSLKSQFKDADKDQTGVIRINELQAIMEQEGIQHSQIDLLKLIQRISCENHGENTVIKYSEFIAAALNQIKYLKEEKLWSLFKYLDSSNTNSVTVQDLREWFLRNGRDISVEDIQKMLQELHLEDYNHITFEELKMLMIGQEVHYKN